MSANHGNCDGSSALGKQLLATVRTCLAQFVFIATCLAPTAVLAEQNDASAQLRQFLDRTESLRAKFSQTLYDEQRRTKESTSGTLLLLRPGRFRWTYDDPYGQDLISDGNKLWIHDRGLEQVTVKPFDDGLSETPAALLTSRKPLGETFTVTDRGEVGGVKWVELRPHSKDATFNLIRVGFVAEELRFMEIEDGFANLTQLKFDTLESNPPLEASTFDFTPPPGTDVIEN